MILNYFIFLELQLDTQYEQLLTKLHETMSKTPFVVGKLMDRVTEGQIQDGFTSKNKVCYIESVTKCHTLIVLS